MEQIKGLNLIYGTETYLMEKKRDELLLSLCPPGSPDLNVFDGRGFDKSEVLRLSDTLPFISERRVIYLSDTGVFKGSADQELCDALRSLPETTVLIFMEGAVDKKNALYKLFSSEGSIFCYEGIEKKDYRQAEKAKSEIRTWAARQLGTAGLDISSADLTYLTELCGFEMQSLKNELEKLISLKLFSKDRLVSRADIDAICSKVLSDRVFDMISLKLRGRTRQALSLCEELLSLKVPTGRILYLLEKQFNDLYIIKELSAAGKSDAYIMQETGISDWKLRRLRKDSASVSPSKAFEWLSASVEMEARIKQGDMPDRIGLELIIVK